MDLSSEIVLRLPSRWAVNRLDRIGTVNELAHLAKTLCTGCEALTGLYMRMCDLIRGSDLTDIEARAILSPHFSQPRISEILRVSRAPEAVYARYTAGFFGFKAALKECRGYQVTPIAELRVRKIRRAAERLVLLLGGPAQLRVREHRIIVD